MEIKNKSESEKKVLKWVSQLELGVPTHYSVGAIAQELHLAPTTVKLRLMILEALGVIELNTRYKKKPLCKRLKKY